MIKQGQLTLFPFSPTHYQAFKEGREALADCLGLTIPQEWTTFGQTLPRMGVRISNFPDEADWWAHFAAHCQQQFMIGIGGYKGPPDEDQRVEVFYEVFPPFRGQGYAKLLLQALVKRAQESQLVRQIIAHTQPGHTASEKVLTNAGFQSIAGNFSLLGRHSLNRWVKEVG